MKDLIVFGILLLVFDVPFISTVVAPRYKKIGLALSPKIMFAVIAYIIMAMSWYLIKGDISKAAMVGFVVYGVYAFTLLAVLPGYTLSTALIELIWGTLLFAHACYFTNKINL